MWVSDLIFTGTILQKIESIQDVSVTFTVTDISSRLRKIPASEFGIEKWAVLTREEAQGRIENYAPEESLLPIGDLSSARAWVDQSEIKLQQTALPTEGPPPATQTARITSAGLQTLGRLDDEPLLKFKVSPRQRSLQWIAKSNRTHGWSLPNQYRCP